MELGTNSEPPLGGKAGNAWKKDIEKGRAGVAEAAPAPSDRCRNVGLHDLGDEAEPRLLLGGTLYSVCV
jgi:hypothetical protein